MKNSDVLRANLGFDLSRLSLQTIDFNFAAHNTTRANFEHSDFHLFSLVCTLKNGSSSWSMEVSTLRKFSGSGIFGGNKEMRLNTGRRQILRDIFKGQIEYIEALSQQIAKINAHLQAQIEPKMPLTWLVQQTNHKKTTSVLKEPNFNFVGIYGISTGVPAPPPAKPMFTAEIQEVESVDERILLSYTNRSTIGFTNYASRVIGWKLKKAPSEQEVLPILSRTLELARKISAIKVG